MKKRLFILIFIFCLFMVPNTVHAEFKGFGDGQPFGPFENNSSTVYPLTEGFYYTTSSIDRTPNYVKSIKFYPQNELRIVDNSDYFEFAYFFSYTITNLEQGFASFDTSDFNVIVRQVYSNGFIYYCSTNFNNGFATAHCPVPKSSTHVIKYIEFLTSNTMSFPAGSSSQSDFKWMTSDIFLGLSPYFYCYTDDLLDEERQQNKTATEQLEEQKKQTEEQKETNETLKDDDTTGASSSANSFFSDFDNNTFGLSDIITMPLTFINGLASAECYELELPLPFVNKTAKLPCMTSIYQSYFGSFLTIYQTITTGIIAYWVCINIFRMIQGFKNPDKDEIEVMDL